MDIGNIEKRVAYLKQMIIMVRSSPVLSFNEMLKIDEMGIYIVLYNDEVLYVGKTTRQGKFRLKELGSHFLSHTLNNKLMAEELRRIGHVVERLDSKWKLKLIDSNLIPLDDFVKAKKTCISKIKNDYQFQFYSTRSIDINNLEHFFISVLYPLYND